MTYMPKSRLFGEIPGKGEMRLLADRHGSPLCDSVRASRSGNAAGGCERSESIVYAANLPKLCGGGDRGTWLPLRGARIGETGPPDTIFGCDEAGFMAASLPGGSVLLTNAGGARARLALRWLRLGDDVWQLYYCIRTRAAYAEAAWLACGAPYRFDDAGYPLEGRSRSPILGLLLDGRHFGDIDICHPDGGLTQFEDRWACVRVNVLAVA